MAARAYSEAFPKASAVGDEMTKKVDRLIVPYAAESFPTRPRVGLGILPDLCRSEYRMYVDSVMNVFY